MSPRTRSCSKRPTRNRVPSKHHSELPGERQERQLAGDGRSRGRGHGRRRGQPTATASSPHTKRRRVTSDEEDRREEDDDNYDDIGEARRYGGQHASVGGGTDAPGGRGGEVATVEEPRHAEELHSHGSQRESLSSEPDTIRLFFADKKAVGTPCVSAGRLEVSLPVSLLSDSPDEPRDSDATRSTMYDAFVSAILADEDVQEEIEGVNVDAVQLHYCVKAARLSFKPGDFFKLTVRPVMASRHGSNLPLTTCIVV